MLSVILNHGEKEPAFFLTQSERQTDLTDNKVSTVQYDSKTSLELDFRPENVGLGITTQNGIFLRPSFHLDVFVESFTRI